MCAAASRRLEAALDELGAAPTEVRVEPVDAIARAGVGGKLRIVVDRTPPERPGPAGAE